MSDLEVENQRVWCFLTVHSSLAGPCFIITWTAHRSCWSQPLASSFCFNFFFFLWEAFFFFYLKASINILGTNLNSTFYLGQVLVSNWKCDILSLNWNIVFFCCVPLQLICRLNQAQKILRVTGECLCNYIEWQFIRKWNSFHLSFRELFYFIFFP